MGNKSQMKKDVLVIAYAVLHGT